PTALTATLAIRATQRRLDRRPPSAVGKVDAAQRVAALLLAAALVEHAVDVDHVALGGELDDLLVDQLDPMLGRVEPLEVSIRIRAPPRRLACRRPRRR